MGLYDREYYRSTRGGGSNLLGDSAIRQILAACIILFVANMFMQQGMLDQGRINAALAVGRGDALRPWRWYTFLTYGFVHADLRHLAFNMFALWTFGQMLEMIYSSGKIWRIFLGAILFASLGQILLSYPFTPGGFAAIPGLLGASGGVMALAVLTACHFPNNRVLLFGLVPLTLWQLAIGYVAIDFLGVLSSGANGQIGHIAHLSGAAFGAVYYNYLRSWDQGGSWFAGSRRSNAKRGWRSRLGGPTLKTYRPPEESERPVTGKVALEQEVDRILEKIQEHGRASLTAAEQQTLEDASRQYRDSKKQSK